jgi:hypothetical protein
MDWPVSLQKNETLCNGVIDFFANDSNMCQSELCGLAKKLKEDSNTAAKERVEHLLHKKQTKDAVRVLMERVECQLGFRSVGKGITVT